MYRDRLEFPRSVRRTGLFGREYRSERQYGPVVQAEPLFVGRVGVDQLQGEGQRIAQRRIDPQSDLAPQQVVVIVVLPEADDGVVIS